MKSLNNPHNPGVYALFLRTGIMEKMNNRFTADVGEAIFAQRRNAYALLKSGIITYAEHMDLCARINRKTGALFLKAFRSEFPPTERRKLVAVLRRYAPLGVSRYQIRNGIDARS